MIPANIWNELVSGVMNHLWQSTLFAAVAGLLTLVLRKNQARARHYVWLTASVKFLIPFSLLISIGNQVSLPERTHATPAIPQRGLPMMLQDVFVPSAFIAPARATVPAQASSIPTALAIVWACGFSAVLFLWGRQWWRIRITLRSAKPLGMVRGIPVRSGPELLEPGVFGIFRPVFLLPKGISDHLTPAEFEAILAHELCHVQRRDNLVATLHMVVEALFWFHPLVWWMEKRLIDERERACDEEVLRQGSEPQVYAEGILKVCEFYLESPSAVGMTCVAGVTGSNLKLRIEEIMRGRVANQLTLGKKLLLSMAGVAAMAVPVVVGMVNGPLALAQPQASSHEHLAFEVASVKPNKDGDNHGMGLSFLPGGGISAKGVPLYAFIAFAYDLPIQSSRISGGPDWLRSDRFDIEARAAKDAIPKNATVRIRDEKVRLMLQTLLADRFKLVIHVDKKELPVYAAVVGKNGLKLEKSKIDEKNCPENDPGDGTSCHSFRGGMGRGLHGTAVDMSDLVGFVANWSDRPVVDRTGVKGLYNIQTDGWAPMQPREGGDSGKGEDGVPWSERQTLFTIFEKMGLKLESSKAPIEMYTILSAEKPTGN